MIFSRIQRPRFISTLSVLFLALQISACSTEDQVNASTGSIEQDGQTAIDETNSSRTVIFGGTDSGSVIEDNNPDNNLLAVTGKLSIINTDSRYTSFIADTIIGNYGNLNIDSSGNWRYTTDNSQAIIQNLAAGETLTDNLTVSNIGGANHTITITIIGVDEAGTPPPSQPAVISGINSGTVIEDFDPDNNGLLEISAKLNISDSDPGEASFIANTITGTYGNIVIHTDGNWHYSANNNQAAIQNLDTGKSLTDSITVSSIDGTTHTITIIILGVDEVATNTPAIISGTSTGSVTEDIDPDNNNLLEVAAKLDITDPDAGEAAFIANTINGNYGSLVIDTAGNWSYATSNSQVAIQNLATGATLTDSLTVSSIDGTTHTVSITIIGVDENIATANITLSWVAPVAREDNSALSLSAIASYKIYYGTTPGQYPNSTTVNNGSATGYTLNNLSSATYYLVVTTIDTSGRESQYSTEITISI